MWTHRLTSNFHLAILVLFGTITVLGITPFAVYRYVVGQPLVAAVDLLIVACIGSASLYAWLTNRSRGAALFAALSYSAGVIGVAHLAGLSGVFWVYPVLVANFLLVRRRPALLISALTTLAVAGSGAALATAAHKLAFLATAAVVSLFSYVFATRAERQRAQLETMALRDPLTGASNRRGLDAEFDAALATSRRQSTPLGLLVFDIDHFKRINDDFGHKAGDQVLVQLAQIVRDNMRGDDRFSRLGGEEFGLLLPGAGAEALWAAAEKLRLAVERGLRCNGRPITISIGGAVYRPGEPAGEWLTRADMAMYRAKRSGRNRTVLAADPGGHGG